eukprot:5380752-Amphidinium_carterae.2
MAENSPETTFGTTAASSSAQADRTGRTDEEKHASQTSGEGSAASASTTTETTTRRRRPRGDVSHPDFFPGCPSCEGNGHRRSFTFQGV